jgi:RNA polymerase sigma-70 factor (ECF subfamily)
MQTSPDAPRIIERPAQRYVGVRELVTMTTFARIADRIGELLGWMTERGITPAGAPFFRYLTIDMERELDVEAGFPVDDVVDVDGDVFLRTLPAGRYATVTHHGHPDALIHATAELLAWADARGLRWDVRDTPPGDAWGCRLEVFLTDPREQPDMDQWRTDLVFRLADGPTA